MTILYTSHTGFTQQYATLLSEKTGYPALPLEQGLQTLSPKSKVFYLGWLCAGHISGLDRAVKFFQVQGVCAVGLFPPSNAQTQTLMRANYLPDGACLFHLQGGCAPEKLRGIKKWMFGAAISGMRSAIAKNPQPSQDELAMLNAAKQGGSFVSEDALAPIIDWLSAQA